jgi:hypothetical protein
MRYLSCSARVALTMLFFSFFSCSMGPTEADLVHLNGYWEIDEVVFPTGGTKEYRANMDVDFFSLDGQEGYRKKVQPKFNGNFQTSDDAQAFQIRKTDGAWELSYSNDLTSWTETLVKLNERELALKNQEGITYRYKRYEPLKLEN